MLIQLFILLILGALGSLYLGLRYKKWLLTMFSTLLFFVLAFQSFQIEVATGGVTLVFEEISLVMVMWLGGFAAMAVTLLGMIDYIKKMMAEKKNPTTAPPIPRR